MNKHLLALKNKIPGAAEILDGIEVLPEEEASFDPQTADILCKYGISLRFYEKAKNWLDDDEGRRLFWIEDSPERLARLLQGELALELLQDLRLQIFYIETLLDRELAMKKVSWLSLFKKLKVIDLEWGPQLEMQARAASLIASDGADFGMTVARHLQANFRKPLKRLSALDGKMKGVPAIVIGAGPSLEKNGHLLESWQDKAVLITAGSAIHSVQTCPTLAVVLDPHESIGQTPYPHVPFCLQGRTHPDTRACTSGDILYFPDSHFAFEPWLTEEQILNTGWTVGNGAVSIALQLGCHPIYLVGMDYCYQGTQKYAWKDKEGDMTKIAAIDAAGQSVMTQNDWLLAIHWLEEMSAAHPDVSFINATAQGMKIGGLFETKELPLPPEQTGVRAKWIEAMQQAPWMDLKADRLQKWEQSLLACRWNLQQKDCAQTEENIAEEKLLGPLWNIWGSVFERELMSDTHPIPLPEKLAIQKRLFFNRVIKEHLSLL